MDKSHVIAIADDDVDDREIFKDVCSCLEVDLKVLCFENGSALLSHLNTTGSERPAILFLDINMPVINGMEVLKDLRGKTSFDNLCIIIYSTSTSDIDLETAKQMGADGFLKKPSDYGRLIAVMHGLMDVNWERPRSKFKEKTFLITA